MSKKKKTIDELLEEAVVEEEEQPHELPNNWMWVKLGTVVKFINGDRGKNYPSKNDFIESGVPFINAGHLENGEINKLKMNYISQEKYDSLRSGKVMNDDVLYCLRGTLGKTGVVKEIEKGAIASSLVILRPYMGINNSYLFFYLTSPLGISMIKNHDNGSAQPNLSVNNVKKYVFPLPPLNEQKRIAEKVEHLLNKIEDVEQLIKEAKGNFEFRRASTLDKAFRGELTKKWRHKKDKIDNENELFYQSEEAPYPLPHSWKWVTLEEVCEKITDGTHHSPKSYPSGDYKYITAKNIKEKGILLDNVTYVSKEVHEEIYNRCDVKQGDVLYIKDGATTGVATVNHLSEEFSLLSSVGLLRPKKEVLLPEYLMFCLNSSTTKRRMLGMMSGNAIRRLTLKKIK
ncbi:restriction endonuclease subunit S, partial [Priestia megaterium]